VAPATWQTGAVRDDPEFLTWSNNITDTTGQDTSSGAESISFHEQKNWKIGQGFSNTSVMRVTNATSESQAAVLAYAGTDTSAGQWFIPSMNELNELCKYAWGKATGDPTVACATGSGTFKSTVNAGGDLGGFVGGVDVYESSSELDFHNAWYQYFPDGLQFGGAKDSPDYVHSVVRPVRAFGALACANFGTCEVGDPGPGGGIIYYVNNAGFSCGSGFTETGSPTGGKCHYLEVAPSAWRPGDGSEEGGITWAVTDNQNVDVSGIANDSFEYFSALGIGLGYKNSDLIVAQGNDTTTAAGAARAYTNNSKSDWYLPTTAELNLLCQWNHGVTQDVTSQCTGGTFNAGIGASASGLITGNYWSSSEEGSGSVWVQFFFNGTTSSPDKLVGMSEVRPVRAF
jgi:hypothetical protein